MIDAKMWRFAEGLTAIFTLVSFCLPAQAFAWGVEGHALVAVIAERHLSEPAAEEVRHLLRLEGHEHLEDIASWADDVRNAASARWHFVAIPLHAAYMPEWDCP